MPERIQKPHDPVPWGPKQGDGDGPRATARATLLDVIDVLAPIDERVAPV